MLLFTILAVLLIPSKLAFLNEVILLERGRLRKVFDRTSTLCADRGGELFFRAIAELFFGGLFVFAFWFACGVVLQLLFSGWVWEELDMPELYSWPTQLGVWLAVSLFAVTRFLTYIDQRIRLEGWEVELRLRQAGTVMEEQDAW